MHNFISQRTFYLSPTEGALCLNKQFSMKNQSSTLIFDHFKLFSRSTLLWRKSPFRDKEFVWYFQSNFSQKLSIFVFKIYFKLKYTFLLRDASVQQSYQFCQSNTFPHLPDNRENYEVDRFIPYISPCRFNHF